jgi:hypothetical protein
MCACIAAAHSEDTATKPDRAIRRHCRRQLTKEAHGYDGLGAQDSRDSAASLSHGLFVLTVAKIDVHDSHRFQRLPTLLGGEVIAGRLEFFLQRRSSKNAKESHTLLLLRIPSCSAIDDTTL